ncbi:UNVERIFIED_ORG: hypothetical protein ABIC97_002107 [Peribacillus simplex]
MIGCSIFIKKFNRLVLFVKEYLSFSTTSLLNHSCFSRDFVTSSPSIDDFAFISVDFVNSSVVFTIEFMLSER